MLQNPRKTLGFKKNMVYKIPPGGGGKPYPASGLLAHGCSSCEYKNKCFDLDRCGVLVRCGTTLYRFLIVAHLLRNKICFLNMHQLSELKLWPHALRILRSKLCH